MLAVLILPASGIPDAAFCVSEAAFVVFRSPNSDAAASRTRDSLGHVLEVALTLVANELHQFVVLS
jgi:hypothetical protein